MELTENYNPVERKMFCLVICPPWKICCEKEKRNN